jgi:glycosyltransferase involved in cell wall biosynthesis
LSGFRSIVWGVRNSDLDPVRTKGSTRLVVRLCAWLSRWLPVAIVSCSERARDVHVAKGYAKGKFVVIPNGLDVSLFRPNQNARRALRREWGMIEGQPGGDGGSLGTAANHALPHAAARVAAAGPRRIRTGRTGRHLTIPPAALTFRPD